MACATHAPALTDSRWTSEDWAPVSVLSGQIQGAVYQYQCQHCATDGRAVEREARLSAILERVQVHTDNAAYYERRADYYQQAADRLIETVKRRQAEGPPPPFGEVRKKPRP